MSGNHEKQLSAAERHEAAGTPMRRARFAAWCVFVGMAATSMTFQTYHAITVGQMTPSLAVLYGVIPLAISIGVLEFAAVWGVLWAQLASYVIAVGAMFESASATGAVTGHAGPAHAELVFGLILDAAALLAIAFINHGPTARAAIAAVMRRETELLEMVAAAQSERDEAARIAAETETGLRAQLAAERAAKANASAAAETAMRAAVERAGADAQAALDVALQAAADAARARENALRQQLDAERQAHGIAEQGAARWSESEDRRIAAEAGRASLADQLRSARDALETANADRKAAELRAEETEAQTAKLARKLAAISGGKPLRNSAADAARGRSEAKVPSDVDAQAEALSILADEPGISGAKLGPRVGKSERWGQLFMQKLAARPAGGEVPDED
jgi:hypothetical protein